MKKRPLITLLLVALFLSAQAQSFQKTSSGVTATVNSISTELQVYGPSLIRVVKVPVGKIFVKESLSVVKKPQPTKFAVSQEGNVITLRTDRLKVGLDLKSGAVSFQTQGGTALLNEKEVGAQFTDFNDAGTKTYSINQSFVLEKDEAIYGLGQQQQGKMVQRNLKLHMVEGNTDDYIPFFQSAKGYGLFWDNYSPTTFTDNTTETSFNSEVGDGIDYYFMYGGNADGVIALMRDLTGQAPMIPLWTYGYWQSKERYKSQDELVGVVKKYRELGVPLDGIIQDWQYWGNNYLWNAMDFLNSEYYNPKKMVDDIHGMNAHLIISIWASFGPQTQQYKELDSKGMLMNFSTWPQSGLDSWPPNRDYPSGVRVYDAYHPEARNIFWKYLNKGLFSVGIDGWWMDSSEPDHLDFKDSDFDNKTYLGSFRKVRNAFPLMTVGGVAEHQRAASSDKRVFILTRSAFAGQQRYGANTWSGDVTASWDAFRNQISAGLNFSLCGIPNWNSDIGGFFLGKFRKKLEDPEYCELYTRWLEFGTFCPMMRSHGTDAPREIYNFGKPGSPVYDAIAKYINLRYSLLPYIYANSWEVTAHQSTMMRALVMDFASDRKALDINDEYMFGPSFLVCPVTKSSNASKTRTSYLPKGTDWYDFWTGEKRTGGQLVNKDCPLDLMPLYVKAGSILPIGPAVQFATEKKWDDLEIRIYPGANGRFSLYEDENDNYDYEKGQYSQIAFTWDDAKKILTIADCKNDFPGMLTQRKFRIFLVDTFHKQVTYTGKKIQISLK
jgi:alpha-D-xyloside xylohydrolase